MDYQTWEHLLINRERKCVYMVPSLFTSMFTVEHVYLRQSLDGLSNMEHVINQSRAEVCLHGFIIV